MYPQLYQKTKHQGPVRAALIGSGHYGTAVLTQSMYIPSLHVAAVADTNIEAAKRAFKLAGIPDDEIVVCGTRDEALRALPNRRIIVEDPLLLMDLPLDVIAESTGIPEAGARHALEAIRHGKHVAMISKEPDSVVGPILKHLADQAGLVYTQVDGDQHGLMMGLVGWARSIGLEVVSAGKSRDAEAVFEDDFSAVGLAWDPNSKPPAHERTEVAPDLRRWLGFIPEGRVKEYLEARRAITSVLPAGRALGFDLCESVIAANALDLAPDHPKLHQPYARIAEIPGVLCPASEGGILERRGVIDLVTCLRGQHESGLGGGVWAVVSCENEYSRHVLLEKGLIANRRQTAAVIYRAHHLCGVETPTSLLCAALAGVPTGNGDSYRPRFDMIVTTTRAMKAGDVLDCERDHSLEASLVRAVSVRRAGPIPAHLGTGKRIKRDIPTGTTITRDDLEIPADSILLELRQKQDELFGVV